MHGVRSTWGFENDAKAAGLSEEEVVAIVTWLSGNPLAGDLIPERAAPEKSGLQVKVKEKVAATAPYITTVDWTFPFFCWR